jgi:hypothetical protein
MKICVNGKVREMTPSEIAEMEAQAVEAERHTTNHTFKEVKQ